MRLVHNESGTWSIHYNDKPLAIGGVTSFAARDEAVALITARGLAVDEDGSIFRPTEEAASQEPVEAETPPPTPAVQEPTPAAPVREQPAAETQEEEQRRTGRRGRPRIYSPEEVAERRREQNRRYYQRRAAEKKEQDARRAKEWWEKNQDKVEVYRETANERRRRRYNEDPEYRARVIAMNKDYQARRRAERAAAKAAQTNKE